MTLPMLRILPAPWDFKMSGSRGGSDGGGEENGRDKYAPLRKLAMAHAQPPRNPNKPFTSFSINDILNANGRAAAAAANKSTMDKLANLAHHQHTSPQAHLKQNSAKPHRQNYMRPPPAHRNHTNNNLQHHPHHHNHNHHHHRMAPPTRIVRPWDASPPPGRNSEASSDADDEEINVDEDDDDVAVSASALKDVSPLDALMEMANKTFQGLETSEAADAKRREQAALFGKHSSPKKRRKSRTAFTNQQIYELEKRFLYQKYLTPADRDEIAQNLGLTNAQVITWFQNRRAKLKRDLEELKNDVVATTQLSIKSGSSDHEFDIDSDLESANPEPNTPPKRLRSESPEKSDSAHASPTPTNSPKITEDKCDSPGEIVVDDKDEYSEDKDS